MDCGLQKQNNFFVKSMPWRALTLQPIQLNFHKLTPNLAILLLENLNKPGWLLIVTKDQHKLFMVMLMSLQNFLLPTSSKFWESGMCPQPVKSHSLMLYEHTCTKQ